MQVQTLQTFGMDLLNAAWVLPPLIGLETQWLNDLIFRAVLGSPFTVSDSTGNNNGVPEPGEHVLLSIPVTNNTGNTVNSVTVTVDGGTPVNYGSIANAATVTQQIPYTISAAAPCGSSVSISIVVSRRIRLAEPGSPQFRARNSKWRRPEL